MRRSAFVHDVAASVITFLAGQGITLTPIAPLGAAVRGVDLRSKPPDDVLEALQSAMATRGFLVFKDQGVLSGDEQVRASELWGAREMHSTHGVHPQAPNKHIFRLANDREVGILGVGPQWHNDGSFERAVFSHVGYHIIKVAEGGGGTIFSHQGAAFDALPPEEQERWQRLVSVNSNSGVLHPVVHEHPISGRKSVYLHLGMTGAVLEAFPKSGSQTELERLRLLEEDEMRHLFQTYNALLNRGFRPGGADLLGAAPSYDSSVQLAGLVSKAELNGRTARVVGVLDRKNGRVAVELAAEEGGGEGSSQGSRLAIKPENLLASWAEPAMTEKETKKRDAGEAGVDRDGDGVAVDVSSSCEAGEGKAGEAPGGEVDDGKGVYTAVYEYEEGDCIFIDNLAVAHRATPEAHEPATKVGLRVLHRTTIKAPTNFDPPFGLPHSLNIHGHNPLGQGVWQGGGLGYRWDETIPMQN